jgi:hypothetical protein
MPHKRALNTKNTRESQAENTGKNRALSAVLSARESITGEKWLASGE